MSAFHRNNWLCLSSVARPVRQPGRAGAWLARVLHGSAQDRPFDSRTDEYFEREKTTATGAWEYYAQFISQDDVKKLKILDIGAGPTGRTSAHASKTDALFVCVDYDIEVLRCGTRRLGEPEPHRLAFVQADAEHLPFADGTFDVSMCENALEHFDRPNVAVQELVRVLAANGYVCALFPPWRGPFSGHLTYFTGVPWLHLLPKALLINGLLAIHHVRWGGDPARWQEAAASMVENLTRHLNGWSVGRILGTFNCCRELRLVDAYAVGEWRVSRLLRFLPWSGELFANMVYLVFRKSEHHSLGRGRKVQSYNGILRHMIQRLAGSV